MPINHSIWTLDSDYRALKQIGLNTESELEDLIETKPEVIDENLMIIGRQVVTVNQGKIDLLGINVEGTIIVIELKRDKTPREVVSQILDYASWIVELTSNDISDIYKKYKKDNPNTSLSADFKNKFSSELKEENINQSHQMVIVASEMDLSTERIANYLNRYDLPLNILFFSVFEFEGKRFLSRSWFIDPQEIKENSTPPAYKAPWNGEYYCSFGDDENRKWNDAINYGFISAGFGKWYTQTLKLLKIGDRVWVNIPQIGYVGVGRVIEECKMAIEQKIQSFDNKTIYELDTEGNYLSDYKDDQEKSEYVVLVKWEKTVPLNDAVKEIGIFGNQNTICRPTSEKWVYTMKLLRNRWNLEE